MKGSPILFGLETEVGIAVDGPGEPDVVADSIALVRSVGAAGVAMRWDYGGEDPHRDARGFRVASLRQDTDEAAYAARDAARQLTHAEIKSDLVLENGARLYNDHAHPEYCTPECRDPDELVRQDRAGERILREAGRRLAGERGQEVRLYKNNTDFAGHSYGCHENYLLPRALPWEKLVRGVEAFLVTRQIFAGAGKFAVEEEDRLVGPGFQISQRADFFSQRQGVDTMQRRPLINTRDEPHADARRYRRFHVILGDANLSPFATRLKVGTTALVLAALVADPEGPWPVLADPLRGLRAISRDPEFRWEVRMSDGRVLTAVAVQRAYARAVARLLEWAEPWERSVLEDWDGVLTDLGEDWSRARDRVDWVAKHELIRRFQAAEGVADDAPWLRSLDLEYHRLDDEAGLYYGLEAAGAMRGVPEEAGVERARREPPASTRACVRGLCVQRFPEAVIAAQWDQVTLAARQGPLRLRLDRLFDPGEIRRWAAVIRAAREPEDLRGLA